MSDPEEYRKVEIDAQRESARLAADMMKHPRSRWMLRPIYRMMKWVERQCDAALKEDGWR